jgi:hypothetical protein
MLVSNAIKDLHCQIRSFSHIESLSVSFPVSKGAVPRGWTPSWVEAALSCGERGHRGGRRSRWGDRAQTPRARAAEPRDNHARGQRHHQLSLAKSAPKTEGDRMIPNGDLKGPSRPT